MDDGTRTLANRIHQPNFATYSLTCNRPGLPTIDPGRPDNRTFLRATGKFGVDDGTRTHDDRHHKPGLYQLSYAHHSFVLANTLN